MNKIRIHLSTDNFLMIFSVTIFALMFLLPNYSFAETNVVDTAVDTVSGIVQDKFNAETGLDKVKDIGSVDAGKIADMAVKYVRGEVPSQTMSSLIDQIRDVQNTGLPNNFRPYTKKTHNGNASYRTENACQRIANQRHLEGLDAANVKARLAPWVDISWTAVKSIASGGKSLGDLIAENTKANVEKMIKEALFGKAPPKIETVTIPHHDSCNSETKITWDPINMRIIAITTGNCQCKLYEGDGGKDTLKDFKVILVAPVTVKNVRIKEERYFFFWTKYKIQAVYKVGRLKVTTNANCNCSGDTPPPPPPPPLPPKDDGVDRGFIGRIVDWFLKSRDRSDPPEDTGSGEVKDEIKEENDNKDEDGGKIDDKKPLECGDRVSVDGRSNVPTFKFQNKDSIDVNFNCDNSCEPNQVCKVLPESVDAFRESCVYCADTGYTKEDVKDEEDDDASNTPVKCEISSNQKWNNALMPGFNFTVLDEKRVLVENSRTYCGMSSLEEFRDTAEATMRFFSCPKIKVDNFKYTDIRGSCSFIAHFGD